MFTSLWFEGPDRDSRCKGDTPSSSCHRSKKWGSCPLLEVEGNGAQCLNIGCALKVNDRITISNTEILQCHTFTTCIVCVVIPPGYSIGDLCSPPESFQILNGIGLGNSYHNIADPDSQAYSGGSAIGPNPTRATSPVPNDTQIGTPSLDEEHIRQVGDVQDGQISATLPWPVKNHEDSGPKNSNSSNQHPIAPTQKKERPTVKPSCKNVLHQNMFIGCLLILSKMLKCLMFQAKLYLDANRHPMVEPPFRKILLKVVAVPSQAMMIWRLILTELTLVNHS